MKQPKIPKWKRDLERKERENANRSRKQIMNQLPELTSLANEVKRLKEQLSRSPVFTFLQASERAVNMLMGMEKITDFANGRELLIKSRVTGDKKYVVFTVRADGI